jgi:hypothetical protein
VSHEYPGLKAEDFSTDFRLNFVPPAKPRNQP